MPRVIELIEGEHGWSVTDSLREEFANFLCPDEALFLVAQMLTGARHLRYSHTYEQFLERERRYERLLETPIAALPDLRSRAPVVMARRMGRVVRTFDEQGQLVNRFVRLKGNS